MQYWHLIYCSTYKRRNTSFGTLWLFWSTSIRYSVTTSRTKRQCSFCLWRRHRHRSEVLHPISLPLIMIAYSCLVQLGLCRKYWNNTLSWVRKFTWLTCAIQSVNRSPALKYGKCSRHIQMIPMSFQLYTVVCNKFIKMVGILMKRRIELPRQVDRLMKLSRSLLKWGNGSTHRLDCWVLVEKVDCIRLSHNFLVAGSGWRLMWMNRPWIGYA